LTGPEKELFFTLPGCILFCLLPIPFIRITFQGFLQNYALFGTLLKKLRVDLFCGKQVKPS